MKKKGREHADWHSNNDSDQENENTKNVSQERNLDGRGKVKWVEIPDWEKIEPYLPILRHIRGSKARIAFTMFKEIDDMAQSIFEKNKSFFRFRTQVDIMAFYIGVRIVEHLYLTRKGFGKSKLSELLESLEAEYRVYDDMKICKEKFKCDFEKYSEGFITDEELLKRRQQYLDIFSGDSPGNLTEKMTKIFDETMGDIELFKAKERIRKRTSYQKNKKALGL
ncbi:MAG: hypothetical protein K4571_15915 [Deltaproteobacteria bacterium]